MSCLIDLATLVKGDVWTTTTNLPATASSTSTTISVAEFGFASANDYIVTALNIGGGSNGPFAIVTAESKTKDGFTLRVWNGHWGGAAVGAGVQVQWGVYRVS